MSRKILRDMGLPVPVWAQDPDSAGYDRWLEDAVRNAQPRTGEIILSRSDRHGRNASTASSLADPAFSRPDIFLLFFGVGDPARAPIPNAEEIDGANLFHRGAVFTAA